MLYSHSLENSGDYSKWLPITEIKERTGNFIYAVDKEGELYGYMEYPNSRVYKVLNREDWFITELTDLKLGFISSNIEENIQDLFANPTAFINMIKDELYEHRDDINNANTTYGLVYNSVAVTLSNEYELITGDEPEFKESELGNTLAQLIKAGLIYSYIFTKALGRTEALVEYKMLSVGNGRIRLPHYDYDSSVLILDMENGELVVLGKGLHLTIQGSARELPADLFFGIQYGLTKYTNISKDTPLTVIFTKELVDYFMSHRYKIRPAEGLVVNEMTKDDIALNLGIEI